MLDIDGIIQDIKNSNTIIDIAKKHGVNRRTIHTLLQKYGIDHQKLKFNHDFFENIDNEEKAYWLGFIMADGCVSLTQSPKVIIKLHQKDRRHLEKWHYTIGSRIKIHTLRDTVSSTHYSKKMCKDLIRLGCTPRKSLKLEFPEIQKDLVRHLIRGYFDGDGYIAMRFPKKIARKLSLRLVFIGTFEFLSKLKEILVCSSNVKLKKHKTYILEMNGNKKAGRVARFIYDNTSIFLDRKKEVYLSYLRL